MKHAQYIIHTVDHDVRVTVTVHVFYGHALDALRPIHVARQRKPSGSGIEIDGSACGDVLVEENVYFAVAIEVAEINSGGRILVVELYLLDEMTMLSPRHTQATAFPTSEKMTSCLPSPFTSATTSA